MKKLPKEELARLNSMCYFIEQIEKYKINPKVIFDIGAYNAKHLQELGIAFSVPVDNLYAFEAHPGMIQHCEKRIPKKNVFHMAISNDSDDVLFNAIDLTQACHHGCSSMYPINRPHKTPIVQMDRMDNLINGGFVPTPDVVKIDVEGASYEVLEGFGALLDEVQILHVETEIKEHFPGQKLQKDVIELMDYAGFKEVHRLHIPKNQDDIIFLNKRVF